MVELERFRLNQINFKHQIILTDRPFLPYELKEKAKVGQLHALKNWF